jgi:mevalonate kinase
MNYLPETFYAKIMLFGEYGVIFNSMGLTIPYVHFKGEFRFIDDQQYTDFEFAKASNRKLKEFANYLKKLTASEHNFAEFDTDRLEKDILRGLYFESTIPQGYGIGSSGALCAAIYYHYAVDAIRLKRIFSQEDAKRLKEIFSVMESYFHGQSSGIDPLLCYIRQPLLISEAKKFEIVSIPREQFRDGGAIFLIDTGRPGKTGPLVNLFRQKAKKPSYLEFIERQLIPTTHACITTLLKGDNQSFFVNLKQLSEMQLSHFKEMIPPGFHEVWQHGLQSGDFYLKLCGSGGGGFMLGMTPHLHHAKSSLKKYNLTPVMVY